MSPGEKIDLLNLSIKEPDMTAKIFLIGYL
jgi:hypothetical protein